MNVKVKWIDGMMMVGESGSGHAVVMDGPPDVGGNNLGVRPMEMLLIGMAGCTTVDVVSTLKKMRENIDDCIAEVSAERSEEHTSELQSRRNLVCRLLLEKKKNEKKKITNVHRRHEHTS